MINFPLVSLSTISNDAIFVFFYFQFISSSEFVGVVCLFVKYLWPDGKLLKDSAITNRTMMMNRFDDELENETREMIIKLM